MSTRPIGVGEFRDIQKELEALSAQVNSGRKNDGAGEALETLQQRLDDFLFYGTGVEINDMTQCQVKLDKVKSAFQRGIAGPSSTTASESPSTPKLLAASALPPSSRATPPIGQPKQVVSVSLLPSSSFPVSQSLQPQSSSPPKLTGGFSFQPSTSLRAFPLEQSNMASYSSSPAITTTTTTTTPTVTTTTTTTTRPMTTNTTQRSQDNTPKSSSLAPSSSAAVRPSQVVNQDVVKKNEGSLSGMLLDDFAAYYWVWMYEYTSDDFKNAMETGSKLLTKEDGQQFKAYYNDIKADGFDFYTAFRYDFNVTLEKYKNKSIDSRDLLSNPVRSKLLNFYVSKYYEKLKSEQEHLFYSTDSNLSPKQVVKANEAFLSLLWMRKPLAYYWTWFNSMQDDGKIFKAATQSGTYFLTQADKTRFTNYFLDVVDKIKYQEFDFHSRFQPFVEEFEHYPNGRLSNDPIFFELLKLYDSDYYDRAMKSKTAHS